MRRKCAAIAHENNKKQVQDVVLKRHGTHLYVPGMKATDDTASGLQSRLEMLCKSEHPTSIPLKLERLWLFPGKRLVGEMAILCRLTVDWSDEIEFLDNDTGTQIKVVENNLDELVRRTVRCSVGFDKDAEWFGDADGVRELDETSASELCID